LGQWLPPEALFLLGLERAASNGLASGKLIAKIGLGNAGLVLSIDASRLARDNRYRHQLLELCSLFGVLPADGERLCDPAPIMIVCC